jgi:two-component system, sensor histidine kinase LadS
MKRWILCVMFSCFSLLLHAQDVVSVIDSVDERNFMPYDVSFFVDVDNELSFSDISSKEFATRFKKHPDYQNKDFIPNASYWIQLPIRHNTSSTKLWLLEFYDQTIDKIEVYKPKEDGTYQHILLGDKIEFSKRQVPHKNFEILIDMKADTIMHYYFKVSSHDFADLRIAFRSTNWFIHYALNEYFLFGTFYGMILIIILYNFLVFLAIREIKNLYYIVYLICVTAYAVSLDGIGFQFLWSDYPQLNDYAVGVSLYGVIISALVFTRRFLRTKALIPTLDKFFLGIIAIRTLWFVIALIFFPRLLPYRVPDIIPLSIVFATGIIILRRGYRPARFFVLAYGVLFAGFFLRTLVYFNILRFTTLSHYSLHISFVIEMLLLTFALGDRLRILKAMRDRALKRMIRQNEVNIELKDKVNRELEAKVQKRTVQLHEKNQLLEEMNRKLELQSHEINRMNSILDLDNWKLKNSIKEVISDRLLKKTMDFKQFQTLYPDTLACHRYLESLKWAVEYNCRKCGNEKYFAGSQKFARRCTRCGYNESITAFTIFHSIKFPIEKAFYLAYLGVDGKNEETLEEMAASLSLRINTVWSFKHKVQERLEFLEKRGKRPTIFSWQEIILIQESKLKRGRKSIKLSSPLK